MSKNIWRQIKDIGKLIIYPSHQGICPICEKKTWFYKEKEWLRDNYRCLSCYSIPRWRALIDTLNKFYPKWPEMIIHESSPGGASSNHLKQKCKNYSSSHYYQDILQGSYKGEHRSEDLSNLTFEDNSFDLFVTQDVFEHIMNPELAFKEIERVLKSGGAHVFTMPWYPSLKESRQRVKMENNKMVYLEEPIYHGNPIDEKGSIVTFDWGMDFTKYIFDECGMFTTIYLQKDISKGIDAEFLEVFISTKD